MDMMVKVHLVNGDLACLLIHIEVQANDERGLPKRVFTYNYRGYDYFDHPLISLVILGDMTESWRPKSFSYGAFGYPTLC